MASYTVLRAFLHIFLLPSCLSSRKRNEQASLPRQRSCSGARYSSKAIPVHGTAWFQMDRFEVPGFTVAAKSDPPFVKWIFNTVFQCRSGNPSAQAIMVAKASSGPSSSQELWTPYSAPGPHGAHPPPHSAAGCQPSSHFSAAGLFHPARLGRPLFFAPAHLISLACTRIHAHARCADALQFRRSHAPPLTHDYSMTAFVTACAAACLCHAVRLTTH